MTIELERANNALKTLQETLGTDFIKKEVHKIEGWNPEGSPGLHPLVLLWYKAREELSLAELTGSLPSSNWVKDIIFIGELIESNKINNEFKNITDKLRDAKQYTSAIEELKAFCLS